MRPRPEGSDRPRQLSAASPGGKRPTTSARCVFVATSSVIEWATDEESFSDSETVATKTHWADVIGRSPPGEAALGSAWMVAPLRARPHWADVIGRSPPGEAALGGPGRALALVADASHSPPAALRQIGTSTRCTISCTMRSASLRRASPGSSPGSAPCTRTRCASTGTASSLRSSGIT